MVTRLTLRGRMVVIGIAATTLPLLVVGLLSWRLGTRMEQVSREGCIRLADSDLNKSAEKRKRLSLGA